MIWLNLETIKWFWHGWHASKQSMLFMCNVETCNQIDKKDTLWHPNNPWEGLSGSQKHPSNTAYSTLPHVSFAGRRSHLGGAPGTNDHWWKLCIYRRACGTQGIASVGCGVLVLFLERMKPPWFRKRRGHEQANWFGLPSQCWKETCFCFNVQLLSGLAVEGLDLIHSARCMYGMYGTCIYLQLTWTININHMKVYKFTSDVDPMGNEINCSLLRKNGSAYWGFKMIVVWMVFDWSLIIILYRSGVIEFPFGRDQTMLQCCWWCWGISLLYNALLGLVV